MSKALLAVSALHPLGSPQMGPRAPRALRRGPRPVEDRTYVPVDNWRAGTVTPVFQRGDMEAVEVNCPRWPCTRTSRCPASQVPPSEVRPCRVAPASQAGSQGPPVAGRTVCNVVCVPSSHADGNSRGDHPLPLLGPSQAPPEPALTRRHWRPHRWVSSCWRERRVSLKHGVN